MGTKNSARFVASALIDRKSCEVRCGAKLKRPSVLAAGSVQNLSHFQFG